MRATLQPEPLRMRARGQEQQPPPHRSRPTSPGRWGVRENQLPHGPPWGCWEGEFHGSGSRLTGPHGQWSGAAQPLASPPASCFPAHLRSYPIPTKASISLAWSWATEARVSKVLQPEEGAPTPSRVGSSQTPQRPSGQEVASAAAPQTSWGSGSLGSAARRVGWGLWGPAWPSWPRTGRRLGSTVPWFWEATEKGGGCRCVWLGPLGLRLPPELGLAFLLWSLNRCSRWMWRLWG